jgi:hypothetical protein
MVKKLEWIEMAKLATILFPAWRERQGRRRKQYTVGSDCVAC